MHPAPLLPQYLAAAYIADLATEPSTHEALLAAGAVTWAVNLLRKKFFDEPAGQAHACDCVARLCVPRRVARVALKEPVFPGIFECLERNPHSAQLLRSAAAAVRALVGTRDSRIMASVHGLPASLARSAARHSDAPAAQVAVLRALEAMAQARGDPDSDSDFDSGTDSSSSSWRRSRATRRIRSPPWAAPSWQPPCCAASRRCRRCRRRRRPPRRR